MALTLCITSSYAFNYNDKGQTNQENYYHDNSITSTSSTQTCSSAGCAYTSYGSFTTDTAQANGFDLIFLSEESDASSSDVTFNANGLKILVNNDGNYIGWNRLQVNNRVLTLNYVNSYLKFEDYVYPEGTSGYHYLGAKNQNGKLDLTFSGGIGSETINETTWNNVAFYGGIVLTTTNNQANSIEFQNGANMIGQFRATSDSGYAKATLSFTGGGNLIAINKDYNIINGTNIKNTALYVARNIVTTGNDTPSTINVSFGESGQKEYVENKELLDNDGVIDTVLSGGEVKSSSSALSAGQTLITNAIKGDIYVKGYGASKAITNINFYNNGLIEGSIGTFSTATVNIYFANKGTIRGNLNFSGGADGTTGTLTIAKSTSDTRVDDLTIEGNINNDGLTSYTLTADKFLMKGQASTGSGKGLTFDTYSATFEGFTLNNKGTVKIKSTKSLVISTNNNINTAGTLTITNDASDIASTMSSISAKGIYGLGDYQSNSNSIITTKGNLDIGILAAIKSDGSGSGSIQTTLNIDNSANSGSIVLSVLGKDSTANNLNLRGGNLDGNKLSNDGSALTTRGNIVIFNNMTGGKTEANLTAGANSSINVVGDIYSIQGNNNLKLKDSTHGLKDVPEFVGNVNVINGTTNLIFDGTVWAPNNILELLSSPHSASNEQLQTLLAYINEYGTGKITTSGGGTANIVLRQGAGVDYGSSVVKYSVSTTGNSHSNIIMQKNASANFNLQADIDYDNAATTRLVFAGSSTSSDNENFSTAPDFSDVGTNGVQAFGVTYKDGVMFEVGAKTDEQRNLIQRYRGIFADGSLLTLGTEIDSSGAVNLNISGLFMGNAVALASSQGNKTAKTYNINIKTNSVVAGNIQNQTSDQLNVVLNTGAKIFLDPTVNNSGFATTNEFVTLEFKNATHSYEQDLVDSIKTTNTVIDLGTMGVDYASLADKTFSAYNLLKIGTLSGENASFRVRVGDQNDTKKNIGAQVSGGTQLQGYADRVIIGDTKNQQVLREFLQPVYTAHINVDTIRYDASSDNNIAVLTVKNDSNGDALVNLGALDAIEGFDQISSGLKAVKTDENGTTNDSGDYTTYFLAQAESKGASQVVSEVSASALNLNYDLYLANINSLNKRMGELRNNDHSQGAWARVFSGAQTTTFAQETKSTYTTIQAGYDYAFGFEGANNYTGLALSYAMSSSSADSLIDINATTQGIDSVKSQAVEVALYNAYVQDGASADNGFANGLYSDTILKFSYIVSDFNLIGQSNNYSTNNYALTFSQEVGYRFLLGESKEWFIDPQAELTVGYLNQTDLKQTLESGAYLDGVQDSILTLRGRVGANFGYKFDRWTESKGFKAQLYLGTYFEGDYISGGDVSLTTTRGIKTALTPLASTSRGVINVGTNFDVKNQHKIYFDFEKSFGGTIVTDYQVNVGYRFAFGENSGYTPLDPNKKSITPLKVSDENAEESEKSQESTETQEATQTTTSEQTSDEAKANSTEKSEAKSEEKAQ